MSVALAANLEGGLIRCWKRFFAEVRTNDGAQVEWADEIESAHGRALREAAAAGVEVLAVGAPPSPRAIRLRGALLARL